ncbi:MAG: glycosyltransferase [Methanomassiliicoccales archaeon]|jgi:glycosyltransferase involved in cell wall biosynthesis
MFVIFDKETSKVIALFENDSIDIADDRILPVMFPNRTSLGIWRANLPKHFTPSYLTVKLDAINDNLVSILYKNREIYKVTSEEHDAYQAKKWVTKRKKLYGLYPAGFLRSVIDRTTKMWRVSPYTDTSLLPSVENMSYFSDNKVIPVGWWGPFTDAGGYASMNREIVFRLHNHHVIARAEICPTAPQISSLSQYYLSHYTSIDLSHFRRYPRVWAFTPIPHPPHDGKNIFFTMMETESLHPEFVRICNAYSNEVWVPSSHNARVFAQAGIKKPIYTIPLGIDETLYKYDQRLPTGVITEPHRFVNALGRPMEDGIKKFRFLTLFGWSFRKGPDILIRSFVKAFTDDDDVALLVVSRYAGSDRRQANVILSDIMRYAQSIRSRNHPQILLYPDVVPEQQMPSLYRMGHAFIHTSRGEGFSLPQIEASACGLPVISCNNTGMSEYLRDDNSYMITNDKTEIGSPEMHWITSYYHNQLFPKLGEEQEEQAVRHMRYVRDHYEDAICKGARLRELVFSQYTWRHASSRVAKRLREIHG